MPTSTALKRPGGRYAAALLWFVLVTALTACPKTTPTTPAMESGGSSGSTGGTSGVGGSEGGGAGGNGMISPPAQDGLPTSSFVFKKRVPSGPSRFINHLYAYDLQTRTERLISKLDEDVGRGTLVAQRLALSPDRQWIAFGSRVFRPTPEESVLKYERGAIWSVSVDGKDFQRLTPPSPPDYHQGADCSVDSSKCLLGERCLMNRCTRYNLIVDFSNPVWSRDGKTVFFAEFHLWQCDPLNPLNPAYGRNCGRLGYVRAASAGKITDIGPTGPCVLRTPLALNKAGDSLLVQRTSCGDMPDGIYEWGAHPLTDRKLLLGSSTTGQPNFVPGSSAVWQSDGSVVFIATGNTAKAAPPNSFRDGVYRWSSSEAVPQMLYEPDSDGVTPVTVAASPDGKLVVELEEILAGAKKNDLFLLDPQTRKPMDPLTRSGDNQQPTW